LDAPYPTRLEAIVSNNNNRTYTSHNNTFEIPKIGISYNEITKNKINLNTYEDEDSKKLLYDDKNNNLINSSLKSFDPTTPRLALRHSERAVVIHTNEDLASEDNS
jgi:hypothetical protein